MIVEAELVGYNKKRCFLRVPQSPTSPGFYILTLPRQILRRGFARAKRIEASVDYRTLKHNGHGYTAKVELLEVLENAQT